MNLDLQKKLDLSKQVVLDLSKQKNIEGHTAQVVVVLDYSGSMHAAYKTGVVQDIVQRLVPIAMAFDDNAEMEVFKFHDSVQELEPVTLSNLEGYVNKNLVGGMGGTNYAPAIKAIVKQHISRSGTITQDSDSTVVVQEAKKPGFFSKLFGAKETEEITKTTKKVTTSKSVFPTYVIFITDGENFDVSETEKAMIDASHHGVFFQFVGVTRAVGHTNFPQLEKLDTMPGRLIDNANFFKINIADLSKNQKDDVLYGKLLNEYPDWLIEAKNKNLISIK